MVGIQILTVLKSLFDCWSQYWTSIQINISLMDQSLDHHSVCRPLDDRTSLDHSNTRQVCYDPHCIILSTMTDWKNETVIPHKWTTHTRITNFRSSLIVTQHYFHFLKYTINPWYSPSLCPPKVCIIQCGLAFWTFQTRTFLIWMGNRTRFLMVQKQVGIHFIPNHPKIGQFCSVSNVIWV